MTQDDIIRMAREAGIKESDVVVFGHFPFEFYQLELFAAIVAENTGIEQQREIMRLKAIIEEQANGAQNLVAAYEREKQAEQEPVAWRWSESNGEWWFDWRTDWTKHDEALRLGFKVEYAYAAPVRTKDLTDDEIDEIFAEYGTIPNTKAVRTVIAADRSKNGII